MVNIANRDTQEPIFSFFGSGHSSDVGVSPTDLVGLLWDFGFPSSANVGNTVDATTLAPVPDPRLSVGVGSPFQLGSVYLKWDGSSIGTLKATFHQVLVLNWQTQKYGWPADDVPNGTLNVPDTLFTVPEPTSCVLASLGGIGLLYMARRRSGRQSRRIGSNS